MSAPQSQPAENATGQSRPLDGTEIVILCNFCGFRARNFFQITRHLNNHIGSSIRCGIDSCPSEFTNLNSFRSHLRAHHDDIYPNIRSALPHLDEVSCFRYSEQGISGDVPESRPESPHQESNFPFPDIDPPTPDLPISIEDQVLEENSDRFIEILLREGCAHSVPLQHIQNLSQSLISFFGAVSDNNSLTTDLRYNLNYLIRNPDIFNRHIEDRFGAVFHKMINISQSSDFFAFMPFKKSLFKLLENFSDPNELFRQEVGMNNVISYPCSEAGEINSILINIFIDDFQLCNPLLSKKAQESNSMTGIYYRIIPNDKFKYSGHHCIYLLGLCSSNTFKNHSEVILQYIARKVNKFIDVPFNATIAGQSFLCQVKIDFFSLDSKAAAFLLGFKQSFNHPYCCRFCNQTRENFCNCFEENSVVRTQEVYESQLSGIHSLDQMEDHFGLQRLSPLRHFSCPDFIERCPPCTGHDVFEGIGPKLLEFSLKYFISKSFITYRSFCHEIQSFKFIGKDNDYFPRVDFPSISQIRFTINESYTFFRFYKMFLKNVPLDDPVFMLVSVFVEIVNLVMCFEFRLENVHLLSNTIQDFLRLCSQNSGENGIKMTIKFHHLVHLPRLILQFGSPRYFSTLNFEQHNHFLKRLMMSSSNWVNPPETICIKYAQERCLSLKKVPKEVGKNLFPGLLPVEVSLQCPTTNEKYYMMAVTINNIKYVALKSFVFLNRDENDALNFLFIEKIFSVDGEYFFYGNVYEGIINEFNQVFLHNQHFRSALKYSSIEYNFSSYNLYQEGSRFFVMPYCWI